MADIRSKDWRKDWKNDEGDIHQSPLPAAVDQIKGTCIAHGIHNTLISQGRVIGGRHHQLAPALSLKQLLFELEKRPKKDRCIHNILLHIHRKGLVDEDHWDDVRHRVKAKATRYYINYRQGYDPSSDTFEQEVEEALDQYPMLGEFMFDWDTFEDDSVPYRPPVATGEGHAVCLTGYGVSELDNETPVWRFLNSHGLDYGREGHGEVAKDGLHWVYQFHLKPWW